MPEKVRSIGVIEEVYLDLVAIQDAHKKAYNANKTFSQIIQDLLAIADEKERTDLEADL